MAREERDQLVDAGNDLVGDAEVGEAVVRVVDAASGREVRLEAAQLDLKGLVEEGAVVPRGDAQDVGVVRGGSDFVDMGQRVHEQTHVVQLTVGCVPALHEVCALMFKVCLGRGRADLLHGVDERRQQPLRCLCTHGPLS